MDRLSCFCTVTVTWDTEKTTNKGTGGFGSNRTDPPFDLFQSMCMYLIHAFPNRCSKLSCRFLRNSTYVVLLSYSI